MSDPFGRRPDANGFSAQVVGVADWLATRIYAEGVSKGVGEFSGKVRNSFEALRFLFEPRAQKHAVPGEEDEFGGIPPGVRAGAPRPRCDAR